MTINIPDQTISAFLNGVTGVLAVVAVGFLLFFILKGLAQTFSFTRIVLVIALAPMTLIGLLGNNETSLLFILATVTILLGISIDGIHHLFTSGAASTPASNPAERDEEAVEPNRGVMAAEKAISKSIFLMVAFVLIMTVFSGSIYWVLGDRINRMDEPVKALIESHDQQLSEISSQIEQRLEQGFEQSFEQATSISNDVIRCLVLIDMMQKRIIELSENMESLQEDLADVCSCEAISEAEPLAPDPALIPENSPALHYTLNNDVSVDDDLYPAESTRTICIDSKFPLESYLRMNDTTLDDDERRAAEQQFIKEISTSPKTFWALIEKAQMAGPYHKTRSLQLLENMKMELLRGEIEELKKFIENNCKTTP